MIRLLNGQLGRADKKLNALSSSHSVRKSPSPRREHKSEIFSPPVLEFVSSSPGTSPQSLVSLESSIRRRHSLDEYSETENIDCSNDMQDDTTKVALLSTEPKHAEKHIKPIRVPI